MRLAFLVVVALLIAWATRMPAAHWLEPLEAQRLGQMPLLFARAASLAMVLILAPKRSVLIAALLLCTLSLAFNAAAVALALVVIVSCRPSLRSCAAAVIGLACGLALAKHEPTPDPLPETAGAVALYWEQRDNPFRALEAARAWAATDPREATLCIARIAERLGDVDEARRLRDSVGAP